MADDPIEATGTHPMAWVAGAVAGTVLSFAIPALLASAAVVGFIMAISGGGGRQEPWQVAAGYASMGTMSGMGFLQILWIGPALAVCMYKRELRVIVPGLLIGSALVFTASVPCLLMVAQGVRP